ncbi:MAG: glycine cleavage system aminomethyltransferase GcvT [Flavobacteriales bacterium AspAUS03]
MKKTILYDIHLALGAKMAPFAGFHMPIQYTSIQEEHIAVRNAVGLFDVSHMGEFFIRGRQAKDLLQYLTTNDVSRLNPGLAQYSCMTHESGGIIDDLIIYKLAEEEFMLVVNAANIEKDAQWINQNNHFATEFFDRSQEYALLAVQGPRALEILQPLTNIPLQEISFYHFVVSTFAGVDQVIISATGYTGAGGFELYLKNEHTQEVWKKIFQSGRPYNIKACGLAARDTLRLEMGYCLYGQDITDDTTPLEAGLGWITKFSKDFIAKEVLLKQKEQGLSRKLIAFILEEKGIPRQGYPLIDLQGDPIGHVTSGTVSPILKKGIGLGYVPTAFSKEGTALQVSIRNKCVPAQVIKLPFMKKEV